MSQTPDPTASNPAGSVTPEAYTEDLAHTGIVSVDHGSRRAASNEMLERFVEVFNTEYGYPIVEPAHMELAEPLIPTAFRKCVERGAKRVMIVPYFLSPGKHWNQDIPAITMHAAAEHPGVDWVVTAPIGLHPLMRQVVAGRLHGCLEQMAGRQDECESCKGTGRCQFKPTPTDQELAEVGGHEHSHGHGHSHSHGHTHGQASDDGS